MNAAGKLGVALLIGLLCNSGFGQAPAPISPNTAFMEPPINVNKAKAAIMKSGYFNDADQIDDPAFLDFLEKSVQRGAATYNSENYSWLLGLAVSKLGRKMVPFLLEEIRTAPLVPEDDWAHDHVGIADYQLQNVVTDEDFPALREIILGGDRERSHHACSSLSGLKRGTDLDFLFSLREASSDLEIRSSCIRILGRVATKDATPRLITLREQGTPLERLQITLALGEIWSSELNNSESGEAPPLRPDADARQALWAEEVRRLVRAELAQGKPEGAQQDSQEGKCLASAWLDLVCLAGSAKMDESVPWLARRQQEGKLDWQALDILFKMNTERSVQAMDELVPLLMNEKEEGHIHYSALKLLGEMGTERAIAALIELTRMEHKRGLCRVLEELEQIKAPASVPRMREILCDNSAEYDEEVCGMGNVRDQAMAVLKAIYPDGPSTIDESAVYRAAEEAKLDEWRAYLEKQATEGK
jgi:HEAT repeat protein